MTKRQEERAEQIIEKIIAKAVRQTQKVKPSRDFPNEWRTLMRVVGLFDKGEDKSGKKEK